MISRIVILFVLSISTQSVTKATQVDCDAITTDLRNTSTATDLCVIVLPRQKWNISSVDLSAVVLPSFDKFSLLGVNGSFSLVNFFSSKSHVEKILIYDSIMHVAEIPPSVQNLLISQSYTRQIIIEHTGNLRYALQTLIALDNELPDLPRNIDKLVHLKTLNLAKNLLDKANLTVFGSLKELETVDLSSNQIHELIIGPIDLPSLRKLDVGHNKLKNIPSLLGQLQSLEELTLSHNKLEYIEMSYLNGLTHLKVLDLRFNNLFLGYLSRVFLPNLEVLRLESCNLHQLDLLGIETPKLRKLYVEDNKLEYIEIFINGVYHGAGLELYGDRNPWNCNWLHDKHSRVKLVVQQERQTCRRFVKKVCCVGTDYSSEWKTDHKWHVTRQQNRQIYKVLEEQQDRLRRTEKHYGEMSEKLAEMESTLEEIRNMVKMIAAKHDVVH
ncbi:leucine-rich repeat-containing protein 40-like [Armigeres subalbatus]|uniref:leucine-rich repeat-containing protein 40-like n=1 Tax=Armigeres subalbatus TaxID=124917 RepID=UPI002ED29DD0